MVITVLKPVFGRHFGSKPKSIFFRIFSEGKKIRGRGKGGGSYLKSPFCSTNPRTADNKTLHTCHTYVYSRAEFSKCSTEVTF